MGVAGEYAVSLQGVSFPFYASSQMIEDYPNDKYGPSCLLLGFTQNMRPLHIQCSDPARLLVKVVTVYEPDPNQWIEWKTRKEAEEEYGNS